MDPGPETPAGVAFGRFRLLPHRRALLLNDEPIKLGGRAFDVLMALIETPGSVISKEKLMARVWPDQVVEENSLHTQIKALRKAFGSERELIRTIARRGYQFTGEIRVLGASPEQSFRPEVAQSASGLPPTNVSEPISELIGREEELGKILNLVARHRLVTLAGAGGIGKTTLALALARELRPHFADGVWLAEFSALADPGLVPAAVAAAAGLELSGGDASVQRVAQMLADRRLLLILDTCEHVIAAAATLAEAMIGAGSALHIIATSREPLRAAGEWVHPVQPLAVPPACSATDDEALRYGAVRLFIQRARAAEAHLALDQRLMAAVAAICRHLDGIPLAIELAAARAAALGIDELADRLDDRLRLLTAGRRTALPRHQTLRATLDWSHGLLSEPERVILRRLSVFAGGFSLRAASVVAASSELASSQVVEGLSGLVAKSLVTADGGGEVRRHRLLDTTRAYALEKLDESGEHKALARRHAEYYLAAFEQAEVEWNTRPAVELLADYGPRIDNLRSALDWAFSPEGDASIGVALTAAAAPLWMHLSLLGEARSRAEQALAALSAGAGRDARLEMKVHAVLGSSLMFIKGGAVSEVGAAWTKVLEIAERLGDAEFQQRALGGLWLVHDRQALALAHRFKGLASTPSDRLIGDWMIGLSNHYLGNQGEARRHIEGVVADDVTADSGPRIIRFQYDQRLAARAVFARILWLQGFPAQAASVAERVAEEARAAKHASSLCYTLADAMAFGACRIALRIGDLNLAEQYIDLLHEISNRYGLTLWDAVGRAHRGVLLVRRGALEAGLAQLRAAFEEFRVMPPGYRVLDFIAELAEALGRAGQIPEGLATVNEAIDHSERTAEGWIVSELLRTKGQLLLLQGGQGAVAEAEDHFRRALDVAREQGSLSWELRAATSIARLLRDRDHKVDAAAILQQVYDRFTEGFDTADLKAAKAILDDLR